MEIYVEILKFWKDEKVFYKGDPIDLLFQKDYQKEIDEIVDTESFHIKIGGTFGIKGVLRATYREIDFIKDKEYVYEDCGASSMDDDILREFLRKNNLPNLYFRLRNNQKYRLKMLAEFGPPIYKGSECQ